MTWAHKARSLMGLCGMGASPMCSCTQEPIRRGISRRNTSRRRLMPPLPDGIERPSLVMATMLILALAELVSVSHAAIVPTDVWLDVDTTNGLVDSRVRDVDDGLAMLFALHSPELAVRGVSVCFGNGRLDQTLPITRDILSQFAPDNLKTAYSGAASSDDLGKETDATRALEAELTQRPLVILALGPVTNIATVVKNHPELHKNILKIVVVAGRRPGFGFHPPGRPELIFPDANFEHDPQGMQVLLDSKLPIIFAGYEVSSDVWITPKDLAVLTKTGPTGQWIARTSAAWMNRWVEQRHLKGFNPFDTLAVGWVIDPNLMESLPVVTHIQPANAAPVNVDSKKSKPLLICEPTKAASNQIYLTNAKSAFTPLLLRRLSGDDSATTKPTTAAIDQSLWDQTLKKNVHPGGWVNYEELHRDSSALDAYIASLADVKLDAMDRDDKLATLINAYNAFTLRLILDHYPVKSIKDIPEKERWTAKRWNLGGHTWSLDNIEHQQIRPKFNEPRIHFALVCAAVSCPPLRSEAYVGSRLDAQLEDQTNYVHHHPRWFVFDAKTSVVHLTSLYKWYGKDFEEATGQSVLRFASRYDAPLKAALDAERVPTIEWMPYDWALNSIRNKP